MQNYIFLYLLLSNFHTRTGKVDSNLICRFQNRQFGQAVTLSSLEREVRGSNLGPVKSDSVLLTDRYPREISSQWSRRLFTRLWWCTTGDNMHFCLFVFFVKFIGVTV